MVDKLVLGIVVEELNRHWQTHQLKSYFFNKVKMGYLKNPSKFQFNET